MHLSQNMAKVWSWLAVLLLLLSSALAAAPGHGFKQLRSKPFPLRLDDRSFASVIRTDAREYATVVLLTAKDPRYACKVCQDFEPEWESLARVWQKQDRDGRSNLVFAELDFANGPQTFASLKLETAPIILLFPATSAPNVEPSRYDFTGYATAETLHAWISRQLDTPSPSYTRPFNWTKAMIATAVAVLVSGILILLAFFFAPLLRNRTLWAALSFAAIVLFTSGYMFNQIRGVPYVNGDGRGNVQYFAGGFQTQNGVETQIVAAMYCVLAYSAIFLVTKCPRIESASHQLWALLSFGAIVYCMYAMLMLVFKIKNSGYPFCLLPFCPKK